MRPGLPWAPSPRVSVLRAWGQATPAPPRPGALDAQGFVHIYDRAGCGLRGAQAELGLRSWWASPSALWAWGGSQHWVAQPGACRPLDPHGLG